MNGNASILTLFLLISGFSIMCIACWEIMNVIFACSILFNGLKEQKFYFKEILFELNIFKVFSKIGYGSKEDGKIVCFQRIVIIFAILGLIYQVIISLPFASTDIGSFFEKKRL